MLFFYSFCEKNIVTWKRSSKKTGNAGLLSRWHHRSAFFQEHKLGPIGSKRYRTAFQTQSGKFSFKNIPFKTVLKFEIFRLCPVYIAAHLRRPVLWFGIHHRETAVDPSGQGHPGFNGPNAVSRLFLHQPKHHRLKKKEIPSKCEGL